MFWEAWMELLDSWGGGDDESGRGGVRKGLSTVSDAYTYRFGSEREEGVSTFQEVVAAVCGKG